MTHLEDSDDYMSKLIKQAVTWLSKLPSKLRRVETGLKFLLTA